MSAATPGPPVQNWWPRVWPWGLALLAGVLLAGLGRNLGSRVQPSEAFGLIRIEHGGWWALVGLAGVLGALALSSAATVAYTRRRGRRRARFWGVYSVQITHLILCGVVLAALYPLV